MWCNQIFSLMSQTNDSSYVIENIIVADNYTLANKIAQSQYGINAIAIDTTLYPVSIGNTYKDGIFYNNKGVEIKPNPTEQQQINQLNSTIASLATIQSDILYEMSCKELGIEDDE